MSTTPTSGAAKPMPPSNPLTPRDEKTGRYLPVLFPEEKPFWDAAKQHRLLLQCCNKCGRVRYPIGPTCPWDLSNEFEWKQMSGRGVVHNFVIYHKPWIPYYRDKVPYALVQVEIEEGPRLTTNLLDVPVDQVKIGIPVDAVWDDVTDAVSLIQFRPRRS
jgi:uncharacterized OB-fold protein